jgi:hypothetical protein
MDNLADKYIVEDNHEQSSTAIKSMEKKIAHLTATSEKARNMREDFAKKLQIIFDR